MFKHNYKEPLAYRKQVSIPQTRWFVATAVVFSLAFLAFAVLNSLKFLWNNNLSGKLNSLGN